jgi:hypothetical protein
MGILSYISEQKDKFRQAKEVKAEVRYEQQKEELAHLKVRSGDLKRRGDMEKSIIREKAKIQSYAPPSTLERINQGLSKLGGGSTRRIPTGMKAKIPSSKKKNIIQQDDRPRNVFGGGDPFG